MIGRLASRVTAIAALTSWALLAVVAALLGWIAVTSLAFGWRPIVIDGASMAPAIDRGDVAMIDRSVDRDRLATGTAITFRSGDGSLVTHRIVKLLPGGAYQTQGDANATPDIASVRPDQIVGAGRLVVPSIGLIVVWARHGDVAPLLACGVGLVAAVATPARRGRGRRTRRTTEADAPTSDATAATGASGAEVTANATHELLDGSMRRMRIGVSLLLVLYMLTSHLAPGTPPPAWTVTALATAACLLIANLLSRVAERRRAWVAAAAVIAFDLAAAVVAVSLLRPLADEVRWALLVLPILEAAVRFRLVGAMATWTVTSVAYVTVELQRLMTAEVTSEIALGRLATLVQRSGVVLLVAVPGGYLSDHLLRSAAAHRSERRRAARRSSLLEIVVSAGQELNRLDSGGLHAVAPTAVALGFAAADVCTESRREGWIVHSADRAVDHDADLPQPECHLEGFRLACDTGEIVVIDASDGDDVAAELERAGLSMVVLSAMRGRGHRAVLRAGVRAGSGVTAEQVSCLQLLAREATVALDNAALVERLRDAHDDLERQANHDPLTGLANRRRFVDRLTEVSAAGATQGAEISMLFLDLNRFKAVNDTHGHDVGDELLVAVAERLRRCVRTDDLLARLGGDEFTVLLGATTDDGPSLLAQRICEAVGAPFRLSGRTVDVSASVGIATGAGLTPTELMRRADAAMYRAKQGGGDGWFVYEPACDADDDREPMDDATEHRLRQALATEQLTIAYQPVVDVTTGTITGFEALARWTDDELGVVPPDVFIPIAEDRGMIDHLGEWILRRACEQARAWQIAYERELSIAVNVSPRQLETPGFADRVLQVLRAARLAPSSLVLEVTERVVVGPVEAEVLRSLRDAGVRVAIDDFGSGQTSLSYLRLLPLDMLKVDREFVQVASADQDGIAILRSLMTLGHDLGLEVIAEGVEKPEQLELLRSLGCDRVQGFLLHRPLTAVDASAALAATRQRSRAAD